MSFDNIPAELQAWPYWCVWKLIKPKKKGQKPRKIPINPRTGRGASSNDPEDFAPFAVACKALERGDSTYKGLGVGLFDGLAGADFDRCINEAGEISPAVRGMTSTLDCYTERSPSKQGLRSFFLAPSIPFDREQFKANYVFTTAGEDGVESYEFYIGGITAGRFLTVTGDMIGSGTVCDRSAEAVQVLDEYFRSNSKPGRTNSGRVPAPGSMLTDDEVIAKLHQYKNGAGFAVLWNYDTDNIDRQRYASHSEMRISILNRLAFQCGGDTEQMDRIFQSSPFFELAEQAEKWNRPQNGTTFGQLELETAVRDRDTFYNPAAPEYQEKLRKAAIHAFKETEDGQAVPRAMNPMSDRTRYSFTDKGNGNFFADCHRDTNRYSPQAKQWYAFTEGRWKLDAGDCITRKCAKHFADYYWALASSMPEDVQVQAKKNAGALAGLPARERMLRDAQPEYPLRLEDLDANPDLFNCLNGTLNLVTGEFYPARADDLLSKQAGVSYDPNADCPLWKATLKEIFPGKPEIAQYLQRFFGYALTARPVEEMFLIFFGPTTRNGKGTIANTVFELFGEYSVNANVETLALKQFKDGSRASSDVARLAGARLVNTAEPDRGMKLNVPQIKVMTGKDPITARFLHQENFDFLPQYSIVMNANYLPYVSDCTLFASDRVVVVPFDRHFKDWERDTTLKGRLLNPNELSGILNWLLEGLRAYRAEGLNPPPSVVAASREYELSSDDVQRFIEECTERTPGNMVQTSKLHGDFELWRDRGDGMSVKAFAQALKERGLTVKQCRYKGSAPTGHVVDIRCTWTGFEG